ncbi:MAG: hypothetical protein JW863_23450 [Chitinispirillaceae bacterium]|nr:hypothetical protein [Chitinispirillaceae bacterium]
MKKSGKQYFTPDEYKRLAKNPFIDQRTLQFVKKKTVALSGTDPAVRTATVRPPAASAPLPRQQVRISESAARLIAITIRGMLQE